MATLFVTHSVAEAVFLSQRVLVMAARPGRVVAEVLITAPYPRAASFRHSPAFLAACRQLGDALLQAHTTEPEPIHLPLHTPAQAPIHAAAATLDPIAPASAAPR